MPSSQTSAGTHPHPQWIDTVIRITKWQPLFNSKLAVKTRQQLITAGVIVIFAQHYHVTEWIMWWSGTFHTEACVGAEDVWLSELFFFCCEEKVAPPVGQFQPLEWGNVHHFDWLQVHNGASWFGEQQPVDLWQTFSESLAWHAAHCLALYNFFVRIVFLLRGKSGTPVGQFQPLEWGNSGNMHHFDCCRFATVMVGSENSSRLIFDKLSQKDLHGMLPTVLHYTMTSLSKLDPSASKKDVPAAGGVSCDPDTL